MNDVKNQYGGIGASSNLIAITIRNKIRLKFIADKINYGIFFGNPENEEANIAALMLSVIDDLPPNCFEPVCRNVVLAGGFWRIRGMQKHFKKQIKEHLPRFPKLESRGIR